MTIEELSEKHPELLSLIEAIRAHTIVVTEDGRLDTRFILAPEAIAESMLRLLLL